MLEVISALKGFAIEARDGRIGQVVNFLFDDETWKVRWLVVTCDAWTTKGKVLIHPSAVSFTEITGERLAVNLDKGQVEGSPNWFEHQPVSQQMQNRLYDRYGWDPVWGGAYLGDTPLAMGSPLAAPPYLGFRPSAERRAEIADTEEGDPHLRSVFEVIGYHVHALDGDIGHVENFIFDNEDWRLYHFVIDTSNWWIGKRVLVPTHSAKSVEWSDRRIQLDLSRNQVKASPVWDPLIAFKEIAKTHLHKPAGWL